MRNDEVAAARMALEDAAKAFLTVRMAMDQQEARSRELFRQEAQALRNAVTRTRQDIDSIVRGASAQITQEAKQSVASVTADYDRAVTATSARLHEASKTVWGWFAAAGGILLAVLIVGWAVLGYFRRELADAQEQFQRYENALPVLEAFSASDAMVCDGRLCVNVDPNARRAGDKRQYRPAKPRPQK